MELNTVGIAGTVAAAPEKYHNIYGQGNVYALWLDTTRDSGTVDRILVLFQEDRIETGSFSAKEWDFTQEGDRAALIEQGGKVEVTGRIQTYKNRETGRTQLFVWAHYVAAIPANSQELNVVYIKGEVAKVPVYRETPMGRRITDIMVCVRSEFSAGFYSYIPCLAWGKLAYRAAEFPEGTTVYLEGRIQSREYVKRTPEGDKLLTTWEVSAHKLEARIEGNQGSGN